METLIERLWHHTSGDDVVQLLTTDLRNGLDRFEIDRRQQHFGANAIPLRRGPGPLIRFLMQFHQPLLYILLSAAAITAFLDEWVDASVIFGVVLVNAVIGYLQESKAAKALEALAKTTPKHEWCGPVKPAMCLRPNWSRATSCCCSRATRFRRTCVC